MKQKNKHGLTDMDISVLKYCHNGGELSGFEGGHVFDNLYELGYLNGDLEMTFKSREFIKNYPNFDQVIPYNNKTVIVIKPKLNRTEADNV